VIGGFEVFGHSSSSQGESFNLMTQRPSLTAAGGSRFWQIRQMSTAQLEGMRIWLLIGATGVIMSVSDALALLFHFSPVRH
jgi:hypothetical protein